MQQAIRFPISRRLSGTYAMSLCASVIVLPMMRMKEITMEVFVKKALASENNGANKTYIAASDLSAGCSMSTMC